MKPPYEDDPNWITGWCPKCNDWKTFYHDSLSEKNRTKLLPSCPDCLCLCGGFLGIIET